MGDKRLGLSIAEGVLRALLIAVLIYATYYLARIAYDYGYHVYNQEAMEQGEGRPVHITIPEDASVSDVAKILERAGLIKDTRLFSLQERLSGYHNKIRPGDYDLSTSMTPDEMIRIMAATPEGEEDAQEDAIYVSDPQDGGAGGTYEGVEDGGEEGTGEEYQDYDELDEEFWEG